MLKGTINSQDKSLIILAQNKVRLTGNGQPRSYAVSSDNMLFNAFWRIVMVSGKELPNIMV